MGKLHLSSIVKNKLQNFFLKVVFYIYTIRIAYLLKYLHRIFGANPATWTVCWRESRKERTAMKYFSQHPFKYKLSDGN